MVSDVHSNTWTLFGGYTRRSHPKVRGMILGATRWLVQHLMHLPDEGALGNGDRNKHEGSTGCIKRYLIQCIEQAGDYLVESKGCAVARMAVRLLPGSRTVHWAGASSAACYPGSSILIDPNQQGCIRGIGTSLQEGSDLVLL